MKAIDLTNVQEAGDSTRLPAGGYVCKYTNVEDVESKQYLLMEFDIAEGEYAGYYKELESRAKFWGGSYFRSYKQTALGFFKRMCSAVTKSNPGFVFDGKQNSDEKTLVGKYIGLVLREEEYVGNDGSVKTRLKADKEYSIEDIRNGNFKVPPIKKLDDTTNPTTNNPDSFMEVPDEESPFN